MTDSLHDSYHILQPYPSPSCWHSCIRSPHSRWGVMSGDPFRPTSYPFGSIPSSDSLHTHSGPLYLRIHSNSFRSTLILILSSSLPFTTQSGTVLCSPVHSLILLLFNHLCHLAFGQAGSCAHSIYSLSYWAKGFLRVFSLDPPSPGMSEWCT